MTDDELMMHFITTAPIRDGALYKSEHLHYYKNRLDYHNTTIAYRSAVTSKIYATDNVRRQAIHWQERFMVLLSAYEALNGHKQ